jgi:hypothetical protein
MEDSFIDRLNRLKDKLDFDGRNDMIACLQIMRYACYDAGFQDGVRCFSWMRDGESFVGSGLKSLKGAIEDRKKLHNYSPDHVEVR